MWLAMALSKYQLARVRGTWMGCAPLVATIDSERALVALNSIGRTVASPHPGGAVHGGPGANAARAALARTGVGGALCGRSMRAPLDLVYASANRFNGA